jgi:hypothetical protein
MTSDQIKQRLADAGLQVKPLVWIGDTTFSGSVVYQIIQDDEGDFGFRASSAPATGHWSWPSREEAQAAANDHYASRIYEALQETEE